MSLFFTPCLIGKEAEISELLYLTNMAIVRKCNIILKGLFQLNNNTIVINEDVLDELFLANDEGDTIGVNESSDSGLNSDNDAIPTYTT